MPGVDVVSLRKKYGDTVALDDVTFTAKEGMFTTLLGPSGSGKTTVLRCIAGLEEPDGGEIWIGDNLVFSSSKHFSAPPEERGIGMVFQSYAIWPHMTVFENIAYPLRVRRMSKDEVEKRVKDTLELVRLEGLENRLAPNLSGGQQQRVALARALVYNPKVLLLDEPLSNLDARLRERMRTELKELQRRVSITTIYVTHDRLEALALGDEMALMRRGKIEAVGRPHELYEYPPNRFVAAFLCRMNIFAGKKTGSANRGFTRVETSIGPIYCKIPESLEGESEVMVCFRRNGAEVVREQPDGLNVLKGVVKSRVYEGEYIEYEIGVEGETIKVRSMDQYAQPFEKAEQVYIKIPPEACVVVKKEEVPIPE